MSKPTLEQLYAAGDNLAACVIGLIDLQQHPSDRYGEDYRHEYQKAEVELRDALKEWLRVSEGFA